ncbi:SRR1-like protein isoform X2 [Ostrea edulis]|nr:SRR1-like protein isoform X2 [Ostrea edulis]
MDFYTDLKGKLRECLETVLCSHCDGMPCNCSGNSKNPSEIVTYGVGNFAECLISRYQLALLLALRDNLQVSPNDVLLYDPKFFEAEKELLSSLGLQVLSENEEGKRQCEKTTLFYMPHCGKSLYNNLLSANWTPDRLCHLIIIGNSFTNMVQNFPSSTLKKCASFILRIQPFTEEVPFPGNFQYQDMFNDTALHLFPRHKLNSVEAVFWEDCPEPLYDEEDLEFIPKS